MNMVALMKLLEECDLLLIDKHKKRQPDDCLFLLSQNKILISESELLLHQLHQ